MSDFVLDNAGSGFAFGDDDDDLDSLLAAAGADEAPEEDDGSGASVVFQEPEAEQPVKEEVVVREEPTPAVQEPIAPAPTPVSQKPALHIPTMEDDTEHVERIIRVLDATRKLNREERSVASQFITGGEESPTEAALVINAINVDPMLKATMESLREAKEQEAVDRAFYIMDLSDSLLYSLGSLVSVFTNSEADRHGSRSDYARALVRSIEVLDPKAMGFVTATEGILRAAASDR